MFNASLSLTLWLQPGHPNLPQPLDIGSCTAEQFGNNLRGCIHAQLFSHPLSFPMHQVRSSPRHCSDTIRFRATYILLPDSAFTHENQKSRRNLHQLQISLCSPIPGLGCWSYWQVTLQKGWFSVCMYMHMHASGNKPHPVLPNEAHVDSVSSTTQFCSNEKSKSEG